MLRSNSSSAQSRGQPSSTNGSGNQRTGSKTRNSQGSRAQASDKNDRPEKHDRRRGSRTSSQAADGTPAAPNDKRRNSASSSVQDSAASSATTPLTSTTPAQSETPAPADAAAGKDLDPKQDEPVQQAQSAESTNPNEPDSQQTPSTMANSATLYVSDLDAFVTEAHVQYAFADAGQTLKTVRVARDPATQRSLGYGYVNFVSPAAARSALQNHQPLFVGASLCRLYLYPGKQSFIRPGKPTGEGIFIKNLDPILQVSELYTAFSRFGSIVGCRIAIGDYGRPRGFAYVSFDDKAAAVNAINEMNGTNFRGRRLFVGRNLPRRERIHKYDESKEEFTNLFIKGIASRAQEEQFFEFFASIGPIDSYSMPLDEYGTPRGFGFVNYKNHADAVRAIEELNGRSMAGREVQVARALQREHLQNLAEDSMPPSPEISQASVGFDQGASQGSHGPNPAPGTNLYVKFLEKNVTDEMLAAEFQPYGQVVSAKVMMDENGESRGFGFVCYESQAVAEAAIAATHNTEHWGNVLYVAPAQRRERRGWGGYRGSSPSSTNGLMAQAALPYMALNMMGMLPYLPGQFMPAYTYGWPASAEGVPGGPGGSPSAQTVHPASGSEGAPSTPGSVGAVTSAGSAGSNWSYTQYPQQYYYPPQQYSAVPQYSPMVGYAHPQLQVNYQQAQAKHQPAAQQQQQQQQQQQSPSQTSQHQQYQKWVPSSQSVGTQQSQRQASPGASGSNSRRVKKQQDYGPSLAAAVASAENPEAEKQVIGEALYPKVLQHESVKEPELASRLTGILLEENRDDLLQWFDDDETLSKRIKQARDAYKHWESQQS